ALTPPAPPPPPPVPVVGLDGEPEGRHAEADGAEPDAVFVAEAAAGASGEDVARIAAGPERTPPPRGDGVPSRTNSDRATVADEAAPVMETADPEPPAPGDGEAAPRAPEARTVRTETPVMTAAAVLMTASTMTGGATSPSGPTPPRAGTDADVRSPREPLAGREAHGGPAPVDFEHALPRVADPRAQAVVGVLRELLDGTGTGGGDGPGPLPVDPLPGAIAGRVSRAIAEAPVAGQTQLEADRGAVDDAVPAERTNATGGDRAGWQRDAAPPRAAPVEVLAPEAMAKAPMHVPAGAPPVAVPVAARGVDPHRDPPTTGPTASEPPDLSSQGSAFAPAAMVQPRPGAPASGAPVMPAAPAAPPEPLPQPMGSSSQVTVVLDEALAGANRIRVALRGDVVHATIVADVAAAAALTQRLPELQRSLRDRGFSDAQLSVRVLGAESVGAPAGVRPEPAPTTANTGDSRSEADPRAGRRRADPDGRQRQPSRDPEPEEFA
ncbi:MAG: hypothetical protein KJZ47_14215, partial [Gemmatimonadales bacterium]|nr:hypothetical protein [Gemmatimonadales bacterium]